jgi:predicted double-glycine peptidase
MVWTVLQLTAAALLAAAGAWAMRRSKTWGTVAAGVLLSLILLKAVVGHIPAAEATLFPWDWYPMVEPSWYLLPAMFLAGAGLQMLWRSTWKRPLMMAGAVLLFARTGAAGLATSRTPHLEGTVNDAGVCLQSASYSCGAAAATSFVYYYGVRATEKEMAELCLTRAGGPGLIGTTDAGLMRGLRRKLGGRYDIHIARTVYDDLPTPALVPLELYPGLGHCVLVWRVDPELVHLVDPRCGRMTLSRSTFERMWTGSAIWASRRWFEQRWTPVSARP